MRNYFYSLSFSPLLFLFKKKREWKGEEKRNYLLSFLQKIVWKKSGGKSERDFSSFSTNDLLYKRRKRKRKKQHRLTDVSLNKKRQRFERVAFWCWKPGSNRHSIATGGFSSHSMSPWPTYVVVSWTMSWPYPNDLGRPCIVSTHFQYFHIDLVRRSQDIRRLGGRHSKDFPFGAPTRKTIVFRRTIFI